MYYAGRLYVLVAEGAEGQATNPTFERCSTRGALEALKIAVAKLIWKTYPIAE
jgi:hypothetical protein